jgi:hypothetical protein
VSRGKGRPQDLGTYDSRTVDRTFHMNRNLKTLVWRAGWAVGGLGVDLRIVCR